jgi:hypothetical protein
MDGVVADLASAVKKVFPEWDQDPDNHNSITSEMWDELHKIPYFFGTFDPMPDMSELIEGLDDTGFGDFIMLTAVPGPQYGTVYNTIEGKRMFIDNYLLSAPAIFCLRSHKKDYATPNSLLIDDSRENVEAFRKHGGLAILHKSAESTLKELKAIVDSRGRQES